MTRAPNAAPCKLFYVVRCCSPPSVPITTCGQKVSSTKRLDPHSPRNILEARDFFGTLNLLILHPLVYDAMANRMDVDDATTDDPLLNNNVQSVQRDSGTTAATEQGELIDFPESEQDDFAPLTDENLGGRDPKETAANKQKMSLVSVSFQNHHLRLQSLTEQSSSRSQVGLAFHHASVKPSRNLTA